MITDLQLVATTATTPNNIMGDVLFKTPVTTGTTYLSVPGNTLVDWMANIKAVYAQFDAEKTKYDLEAATWKLAQVFLLHLINLTSVHRLAQLCNSQPRSHPWHG